MKRVERADENFVTRRSTALSGIRGDEDIGVAG